MAVRPLKDLLKDAEEFSQTLGLGKTASSRAAAPVQDDVDKFAQSLIEADSLSSTIDEGFEKTAMALNRAEALLQIQTLQKLASFEDRAFKEGFTKEQVQEAVEKIAAKKVKENLRVLVAGGGAIDPGKDMNSLEKKKVPASDIGQAREERELAKSLGFGL